VDHPVPLFRLIRHQLGLPVVRETVPEQAEEVGRDHSHKHLFDNLDNIDNVPVVGNLVVTADITVETLEHVEEHFVGNEVRVDPHEPKHLEDHHISQVLLLQVKLVCLTGEYELVGERRKQVHQEIAVQDVVGGNFLEAVDTFEGLSVLVRREEVLHDFEEEQNLDKIENVPQSGVVEAKCDTKRSKDGYGKFKQRKVRGGTYKKRLIITLGTDTIPIIILNIFNAFHSTTLSELMIYLHTPHGATLTQNRGR